jgi:hypothetical protein
LFDFLKRLRNREKNPEVSTTGIVGCVDISTVSVAVFVVALGCVTVDVPGPELSSRLLVGAVTPVVGVGVVGPMGVPVSTADTPFGQMTGLPLGN